MFASFERLARDRTSPALTLLNDCKTLARTVKASRDINAGSSCSMGFPEKEIADRLVRGYLHTIESVFRVLHIPSFWIEYNTFWSSPISTTQTSTPIFHLQLKLVLAIGAAVYDKGFSLRSSAVRWVQEVAAWLAYPSSKSRLSLSALQVMILSCIARETTGVGADLIWISVGSLLRTAMAMGLHRDPEHLPRMSPFDVELRRRLWNTVIEVRLTSHNTNNAPEELP
jgi:hypothetical protein